MTIAEPMLMEKPAIATRYSGNLEFMNDANSFLCGYTLRRVGHDCGPYSPAARWAEPNLDEAAELMRFVYENPAEAQRRAKQGRIDVLARHAPGVVAPFIKERLLKLRQKPQTVVPFVIDLSERPIVTKLRSAIERGVNVRRTVPPLLTWVFQGPRRAMKQFLRAYEQHRRQLGLSAIDAMKQIDAESLRERAALNRRISEQENELEFVKEELEQTRCRLSAMENKLRDPSGPTLSTAENGTESETADPLRKPEQGATRPSTSKRNVPAS